MLVDVLLVVGDQGLGDGLSDGVDLGGVATTGDADADVNCAEGGKGLAVGVHSPDGLLWRDCSRSPSTTIRARLGQGEGGSYVPSENLSRPRTRRGS